VTRVTLNKVAETNTAYSKILFKKPHGRDHLVNLNSGGRIVLEMYFTEIFFEDYKLIGLTPDMIKR
jgi:hypothetical protein